MIRTVIIITADKHRPVGRRVAHEPSAAVKLRTVTATASDITQSPRARRRAKAAAGLLLDRCFGLTNRGL
ncbi:MAG: hypothetical protein ACOC0P_03200, partial [Planctomycetota bacterium]